MINDFCIVGLPRSGQHGIATWIMGNLPSPSLFINNKTSIRPDYIWYVNGRRCQGQIKDVAKFTGHGLEGPSILADQYALPTIFVLRDIKNHMASLIKHKTLQPKWNEFFENWMGYAKLCTGQEEKDYPNIVVPFSLWHNSIYLRIDLFNSFSDIIHCNLDYNDNTRKDVMASGGGSSFDGQKFIGCGDKMKVLDRWKNVELPPIPEDILEINARIFGDIYD